MLIENPMRPKKIKLYYRKVRQNAANESYEAMKTHECCTKSHESA
jgi:hypothetical protein